MCVCVQRQEWALADHVKDYMIDRDTILWRRLARDIPELIGFGPAEIRKEWLRIMNIPDRYVPYGQPYVKPYDKPYGQPYVKPLPLWSMVSHPATLIRHRDKYLHLP